MNSLKAFLELLSMSTIKDFLEVIYYIAFIILTILIVKYAKKTYSLEAERRYELLCKVNIQKETLGGCMFDYGIEIYNSGNIAAKDIELLVEEKMITKIDFIQHGDSVLYPIGSIFQTMGGNIAQGDFVTLEKGKPLKVTLAVRGEKIAYTLCTDLLFDMHGCLTGTLNDVKAELSNIRQAIRGR